MKTCTKCGKVKPLESFYKHQRTKDGRVFRCKACWTPPRRLPTGRRRPTRTHLLVKGKIVCGRDADTLTTTTDRSAADCKACINERTCRNCSRTYPIHYFPRYPTGERGPACFHCHKPREGGPSYRGNGTLCCRNCGRPYALHVGFQVCEKVLV